MPDIGKLLTVSPRDAWPHEEYDFTPWLYEHLSELGEVLGLMLEPEDREFAVGSYSADIIATCPSDGSTVLIENQIEKADHQHLGQIMTYLAGTGAETVVWISTAFSEPHLSAVRWLNEHTVEPYAFFAVRLRVVKIGSSLPAPIFEVLERPNNWDRHLQAEQRERRAYSDRASDRLDFWERIREAAPDFTSRGLLVNAASSQWLSADRVDGLVVSIYLSVDGVGLFLRGKRGTSAADVLGRFAPHQDEFRALVGRDFYEASETSHPGASLGVKMTDRSNWDQAIDWLVGRARIWLSATSEVFGRNEP